MTRRLADKARARDDPDSMGWRFRRSVKIAPGLRLNIGKRSVGASVGPRGAKVSVNTRGEVRRTAGLPGTGLSYTSQTKIRQGDEVEQPGQPELEDRRGNSKKQSSRKLVGSVSAAIIVLIAVLGAPMLAGYLILPAIALTVAAPWLARKLGGLSRADTAE
jgi:Protein of unknown function (DUF4236)